MRTAGLVVRLLKLKPYQSADDAAYQYIGAGKQVVVLQVFVYDKGEVWTP